MTQTDADQLERWLAALSIAQLALLWRWVTRYYMWRCHSRRTASASVLLSEATDALG